MSDDQTLRALLMLAALVLPAGALLARFRRGDARQEITAQYGDRTYTGYYRVEGGMVFVECQAGQRGTPIRDHNPTRTAEEVLIDIYRDHGQLR